MKSAVGLGTSLDPSRYPDLVASIESSAEQMMEAKSNYHKSVRTAESEHQEQSARVEKDFRKERGNIRAARRAAKHARNRVFRRFLETGNEAQACEELDALIRAFESSNVS